MSFYLVIAASMLSFYLPITFSSTSATAAKSEQIWVKFEREKIPELVSQGKVVFVDVTADWCLTCKANKLLVLSREEIINALSAPNIVAMQADWTKPDPSITDYLGTFGRHGIPFNVVYGPGAPEGIVLSELLTKGAVLEALEKAAK